MKEEREKIHAILILEIIGKPQEYLTKTLGDLITQMGTEPGVQVKSRDIKEPKKMEEKGGIATSTGKEVKIEQKDFYVSFAEVELETESLFTLVLLMFKYMPAHVEILTPENISVTNAGWNQVLNDLIRRLHGYDEIARVLQVEKSILETKLKSVLENNIDNKPKEKGKKLKKKK